MTAYCLRLKGGPFDGRLVNYPGMPRVLVMMTRPFVYHDYRRLGESNIYEWVVRDEPV